MYMCIAMYAYAHACGWPESSNPVVVWIRMVAIGSYVWVLGPEFEELFGDD